jgi:hypothetical protein
VTETKKGRAVAHALRHQTIHPPIHRISITSNSHNKYNHTRHEESLHLQKEMLARPLLGRLAAQTNMWGNRPLLPQLDVRQESQHTHKYTMLKTVFCPTAMTSLISPSARDSKAACNFHHLNESMANTTSNTTTSSQSDHASPQPRHNV